jgi:hypothetical protein
LLFPPNRLAWQQTTTITGKAARVWEQWEKLAARPWASLADKIVFYMRFFRLKACPVTGFQGTSVILWQVINFYK